MSRRNIDRNDVSKPRLRRDGVRPLFVFSDEHQRFITEPDEPFKGESRWGRGDGNDAEATLREREQS